MPKKTPIDEALMAKEKIAAKEKTAYQEAWEAWKADPTPQNMRPLMQKFEPLFKRKATQWKGPLVDESAFRARAQNLAVEAIQNYDPSMGTALPTWMAHRLQPLKRFNVQQQNMAMIPEAKAARIGDINSATDELREELGRDPTPQEIAILLNPRLSKRQQMSPAKVKQIQQAQRRDVIGSTFESDPTPVAISRERQVIGLLRPTLQPEHQEVYDYLYGQNGKPIVTSTTQLAKLLKKSPSQVSRIRTAILNKYKEYA